MFVGQFAGASVHWSQLPVYVVAEVAGAVLAGFAYVLVLNHRPASPGRTGRAAVPVPAPIAAEESVS